jgi:hypothetical protein
MAEELKFPGMELVTKIFGYWPSFHDAEIKWLKLDRADANGGLVPTLEFVIHCWETTNNVSTSGHFIRKKNTLVHFRFREISDLDLRDFNSQNAVFGLEINIGEQLYQIRIPGANGLNGGFNARSVEVLSVVPCDEKGEPGAAFAKA